MRASHFGFEIVFMMVLAFYVIAAMVSLGVHFPLQWRFRKRVHTLVVSEADASRELQGAVLFGALLTAAIGVVAITILLRSTLRFRAVVVFHGAVQSFIISILVGVVAAFIVKGQFHPRSNTCRFCRYDLTGNVSGVCSECGKTIPHIPKN